MGFTILPNQPINLLPPQADPCNVGDGKEYAMLANIGDDLYLQIGQEPCGDNLLCDSEFEGNTVELVNGDFTGSATGWTLGTGWAYSSDGVAHTAGSVNTLSQGSLVFEAGYTYRVVIQLEGSANGSISPTIGANIPGYSFRTTFNITSVSNETTLTITPTIDFDGKIVSVYITKFSSPCWTYDTSWNITECGLTHTVGYTTTLTQDYYRQTGAIKFVITVSNQTAGYIEITRTNLGSTSFLTVFENGTYEVHRSGLTNSPDWETLTITPSTDFDGCITSVEIYDVIVLNTNGVFRKVDTLPDGSVTYTTIGSLYSYVSDWNADNGSLSFKITTSGLDEGCYQVCLLDPCPHLLEATMAEQMSPDVGFDDAGEWTAVSISGGAIAAVSGGSLTLTCDVDFSQNTASVYSTYNYPFVDGYYQIDWEINTGDIDSDVSGGSGSGFAITIVWQGGLSSIATAFLDNPQPNTTYSGTMFVHIDDSGSPQNTFGIGMASSVGAFSTGDVNELKSASFIIRNAYDADPASADYTYCSNIINLSASHDCSKLIVGTFPEDTHALGLVFNDYFKLQQRLRTLRFNPFYPTDSNDYEYSNGTRSKTYAKREKYYDVLFDYMGETEHDTISTQVLCDTFTIDGTEYFVKGEDYKPEWDKEGHQRLAQGRMAMRKKSSTIFRNNK